MANPLSTMGKHFVTVCVFCLLCATHSPCSSHVQISSNEKRLDDNQSLFPLSDKHQLKKPPFERMKWDDRLSGINESDAMNPERVKRKRDVKKFDEGMYVKKIFSLFGNGESMNYSGFEQFVRTLHLEKLLNNSDLINTNSATTNGNNVTCLNDKQLLKSLSPDPPVNSTPTLTVDSGILRRLCPVFLYQLVAPSSIERQGCIVNQSSVSDVARVGEARATSGHRIDNDNLGAVWLYSTLSIIIISACGLLGVLVIPIMQKHFYQHLLQFLVALAVGTLAGDALIHLLPHAMMGDHVHEHGHEAHHDEEHDVPPVDMHTVNMWRGFVAMCAMIFFFLMERFLTLGTEWRKQRQLRKNKVPPRVRVMREPENASTSSVGEKLCKHKYSSYPYCYDVIATETQDDHHNRHQHSHATHHCDCLQNNTTTTILNDLDSETEFLTKHPETNQNLSKCTNNSKNIKCSESNKMLAENVDAQIEEYTATKDEINKKLSESSSYTVILREHENKHHGHSHTHGHVHSAPKTMSNVVWMVVMGDGLHNFTDGMAIGAAFAGSLAGGFSTAVAVFCHELPHEIGDFAVLLKAGMSAKQAVFYNMLSSILCLLGMILGVILGKNEAASGWLFAAAAGVFLYIALVDMIPELTTSHSKEGGSLTQCILQFMGLITGVTIMLVIALYENDLKQLFQD